MSNETILVIGASGKIGAEVVKNLKTAGCNVHVASSKESKSTGAVKINLATGEGIQDAFEGVDKVFLLSPGGFLDQYKILTPLIQESKRRELKKVVLMTALGANTVETSPMRKAEIELEKSGLKYNIVRPNWFMQNFNTVWLHGIKESGVLALPVADAKASFIDVRDIGAVIAKLLTSSAFANKAFDLTGPQALSHSEVANEISFASSKKVAFTDIQPEAMRNSLSNAGLPADRIEYFLTILGFLKMGHNSKVLPTVTEILGRDPISFKQYVSDHKNYFN